MSEERKPPRKPPGAGQSLKARMLEKGAEWLQDPGPAKEFDVYVVGFHCGKRHPEMHMEAHHFCRQVNEEFFECLIFDGNTKDANLIGVEYIVSEGLYEGLPEEEKGHWHPHNYEVFSGELIAPGLPEAAEHELMKMLINSYGKTWHTWDTGRHDREGTGDALPMGEAMLMWSFNRDGEVNQEIKKDRDEKMKLDPMKKRERRRDMVDRAHPQRGVNELKGKFPGADETPPPGVEDAGQLDQA